MRPLSHDHPTNTESPPVQHPAVVAFINGRRKFLGFLRARVSDPDSAEEILQRASVKVLEHSANLQQSSSAEAWIYRLLRNELIDYYRRAARHSKRTIELPLDFDLPSPASPTAEGQICPCASAEVASLRPDYSDAFRSLEMQDETIASYAAREAISVSNAGVRLHRARKALRARVEAKCGHCAGAGCFSCSCPA